MLRSPFLGWREMIKRLIKFRTFTFSLKDALYGSSLAFLTCQLHCSWAVGRLLSKIRVTWTQALRSGGSWSESREETASKWRTGGANVKGGEAGQRDDSHSGQNWARLAGFHRGFIPLLKTPRNFKLVNWLGDFPFNILGPQFTTGNCNPGK